MGDLRRRVVRLAPEKPELRPHLIPLLKSAYWTPPLPDEAIDFGFEGVGAEKKAVEVGLVLAGAVHGTRKQAEHFWKKVAVALIDASEVDEQPGLSRVVVAAGLRRNYLDLAEKVDEYFPRVPTKR